MLLGLGSRPRAKSGIKFAIGQVFLAFIFAPTGNGLSFFRTATRSGFERCNKNPNPIINPIFYPIFYPIATRLPQIFICFQLKFHIPDPFQLILALDNTKRVLFCANPEVDFEFLEYLTFWDTFHKFHKKYPISMGKKSCKRVIGLHRQPAPT